jgi:hypothetical protein
MRILLCLVLSSSAAFAGHGDGVAPSRLSLGPPNGGAIDKVAVTARSHLGHLHVTLAFDLSSRARDPSEVSLPLRLSSTANVIGLALGGDEGKPLDVTLARDRYDETVRQIRDPALLEQTAPGRYALAVFPVSREERARVTIELALPHGAPLLLDGVRTATLDLDGTPRRLAIARPISLGDALEEERDEAAAPLAVDAEVSLFAVPPQYDVSRPRPVPNLSGWHDRERLMPTVKLTERVIPRQFAKDDAQPIKRELVLY